MKKLILFLLLTVAGYGQVSTGNEQYFDYGIQAAPASLQIPTTVNYVGTVGTDGTFGKVLPQNITIPQVPINYPALTATIGGHLGGIDLKLGALSSTTSISQYNVPFGTGTGLQQDNSLSYRKGLNPDLVPFKRLTLGNPTDPNLLTKQAGMLIFAEEGVLPRVAVIGIGNGLGRNKATLGMWHVGGTVNAPTATPANTIVGQPYFASYDGISEFREGAAIVATTTATTTATSSPMSLGFYTAPPGSVVPLLRMEISDLGATKVVTTSAGSLIDNMTLANTASTAGTEVGLFLAPTTATGNIRGARISAVNDGTNSMSLKFATGVAAVPTDKMIISPIGNVGINVTPTTTATDKLQVNGNITANTATASNHVVIKSQLDLKADLASPTFTTGITTPAINLSGATASRVVVTDASKNLVSSATTTAQIGYLSTTTSDVQTQFDVLTNKDTYNVKTTGNQTIQDRKIFSDFAGRQMTFMEVGGTNPMITLSNTTADNSIYCSLSKNNSTGFYMSSTLGVTGVKFLSLRNNNVETFNVVQDGTITANKLNLQTASNSAVGNATLVAGTVTITTTACTTNSIVILTHKTNGGTLGTITYTPLNGSFVITSSDSLDTSVYSYLIIN